MQKEIKADFSSLVSSFYIASWQQMGKMASPVTGKLERNLEQAKYSIDMLVMLREKTKGNLTKEENSLMDQTIANLQMNYVDESKKPAEELSADKAEDKEDKEKE